MFPIDIPVFLNYNTDVSNLFPTTWGNVFLGCPAHPLFSLSNSSPSFQVPVHCLSTHLSHSWNCHPQYSTLFDPLPPSIAIFVSLYTFPPVFPDYHSHFSILTVCFRVHLIDIIGPVPCHTEDELMLSLPPLPLLSYISNLDAELLA